MLAGGDGDATALAMKIVVSMAEVQGAANLRDISSAHIDSCLYHGRAGLDFAERLASGGGRVKVPTTLNVSSLDLLHPELYRGPPETAREARRLMDCYVQMGCRATWTCAPYQLAERPAFGEHVAWAESNAIVFCNSVLGARTDRYGDFMDICAAITGRVPDAGLHREEGRRGGIVFALEGVSPDTLGRDLLYPVLGHLVGRRCGDSVPVVEGLPPDTSEDRLKALGAAAASSGAVALFHAVGVTPEAPRREDVADPDTPVERVRPGDLAAAAAELTSAADDRLGAVCLGTPHASTAELTALAASFQGRRAAVPVYVNTGRDVLRALPGPVTAALEASGVQIVTDTCTYITPILGDVDGAVMTDSAKWAWYAPGNLGVDVVFATMHDCVESAVSGRVVTDERIWS
jgi:predicted aconitase